MNIDVCVLAMDRPSYLEQCLDALAVQTVKANSVSVLVDQSSNLAPREACVRLACNHPAVDLAVDRRDRVGIPFQWQDALDTPSRTGSDGVLVLDDDVVVQSSYLHAIQIMLKTYQDTRIAFVSLFPDKINPCWPTLPWTTGDHLLGVATTPERWGRLRPFYQRFMDGDMVTIEGCRGKSPMAGQDVALYTAMAHLGQIPLFSEHRLARYIGEVGVHGTPEDYQAKGWAKLPISTGFEHPAMNDWWLDHAIKKIQKHYLWHL